MAEHLAEAVIGAVKEHKARTRSRSRRAEVNATNLRRTIAIGSAAEHLVCADLLLAGYNAYLSAQGLPYDVILDVDGMLVRISVKSRQRAMPRPAREGNRLCYQFPAGRSTINRGKKIFLPYTDKDADAMAFVALDIRVIAYAAFCDVFTTSWHMDPPGSPRAELDRLGRRTGTRKKRFEDFTLQRMIDAIGKHRAAHAQQVAR